ncbi:MULTISPECIES: hypothetical protein [Caloramator]|uniref:Uncharacterized protein n=1 Tax=Caloramator proteoclasticus DSM 10124 TaxID=1121262 RepID=A0A1M4YD76_9CLOT|nr:MULTISPECIES: hypothetical protein [Caloramator]SHF03697.1 hypothetical protein SAMN02746091_01633 [Caloramator proteoclasticus DSM 10124]
MINSTSIRENKISLLKASKIISEQLNTDEKKVYKALLELAHKGSCEIENLNNRFYVDNERLSDIKQKITELLNDENKDKNKQHNNKNNNQFDRSYIEMILLLNKKGLDSKDIAEIMKEVDKVYSAKK